MRLQLVDAILVCLVVEHDEPLVAEERGHVITLEAVAVEDLSRVVHKVYDFVCLCRAGKLVAYGNVLEQGAIRVHGRAVAAGIGHDALLQDVWANLYVGYAGVVPHVYGSTADVDVGVIVRGVVGRCYINDTVVVVDVVIVVQPDQWRDVCLCIGLCTVNVLPGDGEQAVVAATAAKSLATHLASQGGVEDRVFNVVDELVPHLTDDLMVDDHLVGDAAVGQSER